MYIKNLRLVGYRTLGNSLQAPAASALRGGRREFERLVLQAFASRDERFYKTFLGKQEPPRDYK